MSQPEIVSEVGIDMYEVLRELKSVEKKYGDLGFRAEKTKEYITDIRQLTDKRAKEVREAIIALEIPRVKDEHIAKIIDILPTSLEDIKNLVSSFNITVKDEYLKKVLDILKE